MDGGRLSRPGHCSKGVQLLSKAVYYCIVCCDKHKLVVVVVVVVLVVVVIGVD